MFKMYKTYRKVKNVFARPRLRIVCGFSATTGPYPFYFSPSSITFGKYDKHYYIPQRAVRLKDGRFLTHKIPEQAKNGVWRRDIRKKLKKWGLGWIRPRYVLPLWLKIAYRSSDVQFKWKIDYICVESVPKFWFCFFGFYIGGLLLSPTKTDGDWAYDYWDTILNYLYHDECKTLKDTVVYCGLHRVYEKGEEKTYFQVQKSFLKPQYYEEYDEGVKKYLEINALNK